MLTLLPFRNRTPAIPAIDENTRLASITSLHDGTGVVVVLLEAEVAEVVEVIGRLAVVTVDKFELTNQLSVVAMLEIPPDATNDSPLQIR